MLERAECKVLLVLLFVLSLLVLASSISGVIISILWQYVGFLMSNVSYSFLCSTYQTLKLHNNIIYNYNAIFIGACASIIFSLFVVFHLIYLAVKYCKSEEKYFEEFTESIFQRLYIGLSLSLLGACISVGYYLSYIVEQGWSCLNFIFTEWLILGSIFSAALVFLLIAWIYLLCFWIKKKEKFQQPKEQSIHKSQSIEQPNNMKQLFEALKEEMKHENHSDTKKQIKEPLLEDDDESEEKQGKQSQMETEKQKLQIIPFDQYKKMQKQKEQNEATKKLEDQALFEVLQEEQQNRVRQQLKKIEAKINAQRIRKQYMKKEALSHDDPDFDRALMESDHQEQNDELQKHQRAKAEQKVKPSFPANFVPQNEKERQQFQKYKKDLLNKYKKSNKRVTQRTSDSGDHYKPTSTPKKHPQNIEGGRNKKALNRYMQKNKRPPRDESMYIRSEFDPNQDKSYNKDVSIIQEQNQGDQSQKSDKPHWTEPKISIDPPPSSNKVQKEKPKQASSRLLQSLQEPEVLCFHKSKTKSPNQKRLFQQEKKFLTNQNFSSVLGSLVKGVEEATFKNKLKELREKRNQSQGVNKSKRSEKLLDQIRSKFT